MIDLNRMPLHKLKKMVCDLKLPEPCGNKSKRSTYQNLLEEVFVNNFVVFFS